MNCCALLTEMFLSLQVSEHLLVAATARSKEDSLTVRIYSWTHYKEIDIYHFH